MIDNPIVDFAIVNCRHGWQSLGHPGPAVAAASVSSIGSSEYPTGALGDFESPTPPAPTGELAGFERRTTTANSRRASRRT